MQDTDIKTAYYADGRFIYMLAALAVIVATLFKPLSFGNPLFHSDNLASALLLVAFGLLALSNNQRLHSIIVPVIFLAVISDVLLFNMRIW